jgi:hypothetical protein
MGSSRGSRDYGPLLPRCVFRCCALCCVTASRLRRPPPSRELHRKFRQTADKQSGEHRVRPLPIVIRVSGLAEAELIGAPHSVIRHPGMPRGIFKPLWDTIQQRRELFAYVMNLARTGDHYWVLAHVTPSFGPGDEIAGYHSSRRVAGREALARITLLYDRLLAEERRFERKPEAAQASVRLLERILAESGQHYEEFVWSLENEAGVTC